MPVESILREIHTVEQQLSGVSCNCCGKVADLEETPGFPFGFHIINLEGGYGDSFPGDTEQFKFVVCEDCLKEWVGTFLHPDLSTGDRITGAAPSAVKHCEDLSEWILDGPYLYPAGTEFPDDLPTPTYPQGDYPNGIWEHFKKRRYLIINVAQRADTGEHHVVYQGLYGDSDIWMRPLSDWYTPMNRPEIPYEGPRFYCISDQVTLT